MATPPKPCTILGINFPSQKAAARHFGCSPSTINNLVKGMQSGINVFGGEGRKQKTIDTDQVRRLVDAGMTGPEIAAQMGFSKEGIYGVCRRLGIKLAGAPPLEKQNTGRGGKVRPAPAIPKEKQFQAFHGRGSLSSFARAGALKWRLQKAGISTAGRGAWSP